MSAKAYIITAAFFFLIVAFLHLMRLAVGWESVIQVDGWVVPKWMNFLALIVTGYLAYEGLRLSRK